jgi:hypothetical protein
MLIAAFASPSARFTLSLALTAWVGAVACESTERCWETDSCGELDAGASQTAVGSTEPSVAPSGSGSASADTSASAASSGSSGPRPEASASIDPDGGAIPPDGASSAFLEAGASTAAPTADVPDAQAQCVDDDECAPGVCVASACTACDPATHHGCETASAGDRCLAAATGANRCVECLASDAPPATTDACGLNNRGSEVLDCLNNAWQVLDCDDPDVCSDDDTDVGTTPCGPNNAGRYLVRCNAGQWENDTSVCIDDDVCINDDRRASTTECGFSGYLDALCVGGAWLTQSNCTECQRSFYLPDDDFAYFLSSRYSIFTDPVDPDSLALRDDLGNLSFGSMTDLTGVQCFKSVTDLSLSRTPVADLSPLSSMTWLTGLNLTNIASADLSPLSTLTNLTTLYASGSSIESLNGLSTLTKLTFLDVSYNFIEDVSALVPLTALEHLNLAGNSYLQCGSQAYAQLASQVETIYSDCP